MTARTGAFVSSIADWLYMDLVKPFRTGAQLTEFLGSRSATAVLKVFEIRLDKVNLFKVVLFKPGDQVLTQCRTG